MTELIIIPKVDRKRAKFKGTPAAGEHVAVTVKGGAAWAGATLRLRVVGLRGATLAEFAPTAEAEWAVTPEGDARCELNLDTVQLRLAVPPGSALPFLFVLDDPAGNVLHLKDLCPVVHWPQKAGEDVPVDIGGYVDFVRMVLERLDAVDGRSAYQIAVAHGFEGTEEQWLASLVCPMPAVRDATTQKWHRVLAERNADGDEALALDQTGMDDPFVGSVLDFFSPVGTSTRYLSQILDDIVNIRDYGAVGDEGTGADSRALATAAGFGRAVFAPDVGDGRAYNGDSQDEYDRDGLVYYKYDISDNVWSLETQDVIDPETGLPVIDPETGLPEQEPVKLPQLEKRNGAGAFVYGTDANPTDEPMPIMSLVKYAHTWDSVYDGTKDDYANANIDAGLAFLKYIKKGGLAPSHAVTVWSEVRDGAGDNVGLHSRIHSRTEFGNVWAGWLMAFSGDHKTPSDEENNTTGTHGLEINVINCNTVAAPSVWQSAPGVGGRGNPTADPPVPGQPWQIGLWVTSATAGGAAQQPCTLGMGLHSSVVGKGFYTGLLSNVNAIVKCDYGDDFSRVGDELRNNEVFRIGGATSRANLYGGIRFGFKKENDGSDEDVTDPLVPYPQYMHYGISFCEMTFENSCAMLLGPGQAIKFGTAPGTESRMFFNNYGGADGRRLVLGGIDRLQIGGAPVLAARDTGWAAAGDYTGASKGALSANAADLTLQMVASRLVAVIKALSAHGLIGEGT